MHVTVNRVELEEDIHAGLVSLRVPTDEEIAAADTADIAPRRKRKAGRPRVKQPKA